MEGETLTEGHATWSSPPAAYAYQWQRCNSAGNDCASIPKATAQTYRLTAADVGYRIRVGESAQDAEGAVTPSVSEPTVAVQAATSSGGGGGGSNGGGGGSGPSGSQPTHSAVAEIKALLARQLVPSGKGASIPALLRHGGLRANFKFPDAGTLVVKWYLPVHRAKPVLVAVGEAKCTAGKTIAVSIRLTAAGRRQLAHARKLKLTVAGVFTPKGAAAVEVTSRVSLRR